MGTYIETNADLPIFAAARREAWRAARFQVRSAYRAAVALAVGLPGLELLKEAGE